MLSDDEILRRLEIVRRSSRKDRNGRKARSINSIATASGLNRTYIHDVISGKQKLGPVARRRLSKVMAYPEQTCRDLAGIRQLGSATTPSIEIRFSVEKWLN